MGILKLRAAYWRNKNKILNRFVGLECVPEGINQLTKINSCHALLLLPLFFPTYSDFLLLKVVTKNMKVKAGKSGC